MNLSSLIRNVVIVIIPLIINNSCSTDDNKISYDLTGNWKVIYFIDGDKKVTKTEDNTWPDINNGDITANFSHPDGNGAGVISGIKVSNSYNAEYIIKENGELSIGLLTTTKINEPEWTKLFHINSAENFEIYGSKLLIYYNKKKNVIAFERN